MADNKKGRVIINIMGRGIIMGWVIIKIMGDYCT